MNSYEIRFHGFAIQGQTQETNINENVLAIATVPALMHLLVAVQHNYFQEHHSFRQHSSR